jgi:hypothetical protein
MVDLGKIFHVEKKQNNMSQGYLDSFMHIAVTWDQRFTSKNLKIHDTYDTRAASCIESKETFKTTYSSEALEPNDRYFFQVKLLRGCNFKIGVSKNRHDPEVAFCDSSDGFGFYSAG